MAEAIGIGSKGRNKSGYRATKKSTRTDLTPMVDLGFLLITFFIFTTTMLQPKAMKLFLPEDGERTTVGASGAMTILLGATIRSFIMKAHLNPILAILKRVIIQASGISLSTKKDERLESVCHYQTIRRKRFQEPSRYLG